MDLDILNLVQKWTVRTDKVLRLARRKYRVNNTGALEKSADYSVKKESEDLLITEIEFLQRGRFVDMGVGGRSKKIESREGNAQLLRVKKRRPKKWYSKTYWGRINDLQGVLGFKLMESAIQYVKEPYEKAND
jgi:hypothetical protein